MIRTGTTTLLLVGMLSSVTAQQSDALARFVGSWSCKGHFISNGAPMAADLSIQPDEHTGALIVRHDDVPPGAYHALEIWLINPTGSSRAAISDKYSGMRWFESQGWVGNLLTWVLIDNGKAAEQFTYEFKGDNMQIEWSVAQKGAMKLGDTLLCRRV